MFGAAFGDIIGSPYEFDRGNKTKDFPLLTDFTRFTDDTVMTVAVAEALLNNTNKHKLKDDIIDSLHKWGEKYPDWGYGIKFSWWLKCKNRKPYNSFGNGSAMRCSAAGWLYNSLKETRKVAKITAIVTHNHPEGIKGAEATASCIYLARNGYSKKEIKKYIEKEFRYNLHRTCDEIRPTYRHVESCQETVPEAIIAFLEGNDFEDCVRTAVSLGGDCDTLTAITASIAEAMYGIPENIMSLAHKYIPDELYDILDKIH